MKKSDMRLRSRLRSVPHIIRVEILEDKTRCSLTSSAPPTPMFLLLQSYSKRFGLEFPVSILPIYASERIYATRHFSRKYARFYLLALFSFSSVYLLWTRKTSSTSFNRTALEYTTSTDMDKVNQHPPLYEEWYERERHLPQHNASLPYPEGAYGEYLYAANHVWGVGFNNALQEQLFLSHLAYISNRAHVFDLYTWNIDSNPYTNTSGKLVPSRIPLSAFISGPTAGGSFHAHSFAPRSVNKEYFYEVCPRATLIRSNDVNDELGPHADVKTMMEVWSKKLRGLPFRCVEIGDSNQVFDYMVMGDGKRMLPFLEDFLTSPIIRQFSWSPLVESAVANNAHILRDSSAPDHSRLDMDKKNRPDVKDSSMPIPGLLAIHVRRGDFEEHCRNLAEWGSEYQGWLHSPLIVDRFVKPARMGSSRQIPDRLEYYLRHCWPTVSQIVSRVEEIRRTNRGLRRLHIMTNGREDWVNELKTSLQQSSHWEYISTSSELELTKEQQYIGQAVDMAIAMRSQVFIGNGFSSMTSNVILLRLSKGIDALTNRLW